MTDLKENPSWHGLSMNTIYNMDCIEGMKLIPDWSIDCIITDPPYGTTACKRDIVIPFDLMWEQLKRIIKPNWAIVLFWSEPFSSALRMSNIKNYKYDWVWQKNKPSGHLNVKKRPMKEVENITIFNTKIYYPQGLKDINKVQKKSDTNCTIGNGYGNYGKHNKSTIQKKGNYPREILQFSKPSKNVHPTQKPVALMEYLIKTYTNEWETVLDFTAGSFTTAVAADNTNRKRIGIEMSEEYCEIWKERIIKNRIEKWLDLLDFTSNI